MSMGLFRKEMVAKTPEYTEKSNEKCKEVIMGSRAYATLIAEAYANGENETGGVFLGHVENGICYIVESTLPGYQALHERGLFKMNERFVNYVYRGQVRIFRKEPRLLGLWHRHPESFNRFSGHDDIMNRKFAMAVGGGTLSFLLNFVPGPVITPYFFDLADNKYYRTLLKVTDVDLVQKGFLKLCGPETLKEKAEEMQMQMAGYQ